MPFIIFGHARKRAARAKAHHRFVVVMYGLKSVPFKLNSYCRLAPTHYNKNQNSKPRGTLCRSPEKPFA